MEALGAQSPQLSADDQRRVMSSTDSSAKPLAQHFADFMTRALGREDGDRSADPLAARTMIRRCSISASTTITATAEGSPCGVMTPIFRATAPAASRKPNADLWQRVFDEQPMLAWNDGAGSFELKRGAEVPARLLAELTKGAGSEGLALYRGMSNFEGALYALSAALKSGPRSPNWREDLDQGPPSWGARSGALGPR